MADRDGDRDFARSVGEKAERKQEARDRREGVWFWLGMMGMVGWSVTVPTLLGVLLGSWLDGRWPQTFSWTLTFLILGLTLGCLNAWYWVRRSAGRD